MQPPFHAAVRRAVVAVLVPLLSATLVACGTDARSVTPQPSASAPGSRPQGSASPPGATPTPVPTLPPTPSYTNPPDPELVALIPDHLGKETVRKPPARDFTFTPGDVGEPYGELGLRFRSLQVAYVEDPRLVLWAMRLEGPAATTEELEPYLAEAGRYVGIAGLDRRSWKLRSVGGRLAWVRPEDDATLAGTFVYTWASDDLVFLMVGIDDRQNRAMFAALPAEPAPTPTPRPTRSPSPSESATPSQTAKPS